MTKNKRMLEKDLLELRKDTLKIYHNCAMQLIKQIHDQTTYQTKQQDTSSAAAECVTLQAAGGFNIHLFPTGQGNIIGNPIEPVVKLTANPLTAKLMKEHVDCDVSKILSREMNLSQAGDELIKTMLRVANGRLTCAEALGHREFVMTKLYRSA